MKRMIAAACLGMALTLGALVNAPTVTADTEFNLSTNSSSSGPAGVMASPDCSGTASHGKIRYQVCFRYNCDSDSCLLVGYLGLINTATSARTVQWDLEGQLNAGTIGDDDNGSVTLAAGEQRTIDSRTVWDVRSCGGHTFWTEHLTIEYGGSAPSAPISTVDVLWCA